MQHRLLLFRHAGTEWSQTGQHTGRTELTLTATGQAQAVAAAAVLDQLGMHHPMVLCSPRRRARMTAELAGLRIDAVAPDLAEWDYGRYEGLTLAEIRESDPDWLVWTHGCPGGESVAQIADRADRVLAMALRLVRSRDIVLVGHGHFSRALTARWLQLPVSAGIRFRMDPASIAVCGFEHGARQLGALGLTGSHW